MAILSEAQIAELSKKELSIKGNVHLKKLYGGASYRTYYRVSSDNDKSFIVMQVPADKASASEEITNLKAAPSELPFINVSRYLKSIGTPVPDLLYQSPDSSILILSDLGDETLKASLAKHPDETIAWYKKAIDLLVDLQWKAKPSNGCIVFERSFDETLLNWEFDHFLEYGIERRGRAMTIDDKKVFHKETRGISKDLLNQDLGFTHRDYQSANLMVHKGDLWLIDFQDALQGPVAYDLVSLLRDSYIVLSSKNLEVLIEYYVEKRNYLFGVKMNTEKFRVDFDLLTIQRKLKDAGRFVYIDQVKGDDSFLPYIEPSLKYVKNAFERQPETGPLFEVLKKYDPAFN
jgi:N-acetylmuramate 1-kinase